MYILFIQPEMLQFNAISVMLLINISVILVEMLRKFCNICETVREIQILVQLFQFTNAVIPSGLLHCALRD